MLFPPNVLRNLQPPEQSDGWVALDAGPRPRIPAASPTASGQQRRTAFSRGGGAGAGGRRVTGGPVGLGLGKIHFVHFCLTSGGICGQQPLPSQRLCSKFSLPSCSPPPRPPAGMLRALVAASRVPGLRLPALMGAWAVILLLGGPACGLLAPGTAKRGAEQATAWRGDRGEGRGRGRERGRGVDEGGGGGRPWARVSSAGRVSQLHNSG